MLERQIDQHERRATLDNDRKVREERHVFAQDQSLRSSTFHQHAQADADTPRGRFSAVSNAYVVGSTPQVNYPAAAAHQRDPCGPEPSLGYAIDAMPEPEPPALPEAPTGEPLSAPPLGGSPLSQGGSAPEVIPASVSANAGPSTFRRRV
jgi:hypothetical protein